MALTKDDLQSIRSIVREETNGFARKSDLTPFATKRDLHETATGLRVHLVSKADLKEGFAETEDRLGKKMELETEKLARITGRAFTQLQKRTDELARHAGYTYEREANEES